MASKKKVHMYVLSVDYEGGDGAEYHPIKQGKGWAKNARVIGERIGDALYATFPPPKVEVIGLTKAEWAKAVRVGRENA